WRQAARAFREAGVSPAEARFVVVGAGQTGLFDEPRPPPREAGDAAAFSVPRAFVETAQTVVLHRSADRFDLLYRLLWRLREEPELMRVVSDRDVADALERAKNVSRASHKMKAFVRLRPVEDEQGEAWVAWFEPAHRVVEMRAAIFGGSLRPAVPPAVAAARGAGADAGGLGPRRRRRPGAGEERLAGQPQDEGLRPLPAGRGRAGRGMGRLVRAGAPGGGDDRPLLRPPLRHHALVDPDAGRQRALGRGDDRLRAAGDPRHGARRGRDGGVLADLLRLDLQSGAAEDPGDAGRDAQALLEEPARGGADPGTGGPVGGSHRGHGRRTRPPTKPPSREDPEPAGPRRQFRRGLRAFDTE